MIELERTFLARKLPVRLKQCPHITIIDSYVPSSAEHPCLRLRQKSSASTNATKADGDRYEITKKQPVPKKYSASINVTKADGFIDSSRQLEQTIPLTKEEFEELAQTGGKRLEKTRYEYKEGGNVFEIDVFEGLLKGLVLVDIEFGTEKEKADFRMPDFCLADVTQEKFAAGGMLAGKSYKDIEQALGKWGYKKLCF